MTENEIFDTGPELAAAVMDVLSRHLIVGQLREADRKYAAEAVVFDLLCLYRDRFAEAE